MAAAPSVLVLSPWTTVFYFGEIIAGITREVAAAGCHVIVAQTLDTSRQTPLHVAAPDFAIRVAWDHIGGAVAVAVATQGTYLEALRQAGKHVTLAGNRIAGFDAPLAMPDNDGGSRSAVLHLLKHGHRRIGFAGNLTQSDMRERYAAYHDALVEAGIEPRPADFYPAKDNVETGGESSAHEFLRQTDRPTAVVIATDENALGFIRAVTAAGLDVPEDVAVVGYDDIEASAFSNPPLAIVNQRFDTIGALAGRLLMAQMRGEEPSSDTHAVPSHVVRRASCGWRNGDNRVPGPPGSVDDDAREVLRRRLEASLTTSRNGAHFRPAVAAAVGALSEAAEHPQDAAGDDHTAGRLTEAFVPLAALTTRPEVLQVVDGAVTHYLKTLADHLPDEARTTRAALAELRDQASGVLWHPDGTGCLHGYILGRDLH